MLHKMKGVETLRTAAQAATLFRWRRGARWTRVWAPSCRARRPFPREGGLRPWPRTILTPPALLNPFRRVL